MDNLTDILKEIRERAEKSETIFWRNISESGECWLWNGFLNPAGYGQTGQKRLYRKYGTWRVHKHFELTVGRHNTKCEGMRW